MTKEIFTILACVPLYVINSFCDKIVSSKDENKYNYVYNAIKFLICSLCMLPAWLLDDSPAFTAGALLCGIACGVMYAISKTVMLKGYERTSVAFMTLCHSSGMILPCIIGHFFWSERLSGFSVVGIFLAVTSIVLLKGGKGDGKKFGIQGLTLGIIIFLTSAGVMITQKLMGIHFADESVGAYTFYSFIAPFLLLSCLIRPRAIKGAERTTVTLVGGCACASAVSLAAISFVMTSLSGAVPSVILFPLFNGLGIIFVCIGSVFAFKEKLTLTKIVGLALGVFGLCLINF